MSRQNNTAEVYIEICIDVVAYIKNSCLVDVGDHSTYCCYFMGLQFQQWHPKDIYIWQIYRLFSFIILPFFQPDSRPPPFFVCVGCTVYVSKLAGLRGLVVFIRLSDYQPSANPKVKILLMAQASVDGRFWCWVNSCRSFHTFLTDGIGDDSWPEANQSVITTDFTKWWSVNISKINFVNVEKKLTNKLTEFLLGERGGGNGSILWQKHDDISLSVIKHCLSQWRGY